LINGEPVGSELRRGRAEARTWGSSPGPGRIRMEGWLSKRVHQDQFPLLVITGPGVRPAGVSLTWGPESEEE
jgi:hypothetical protein